MQREIKFRAWNIPNKLMYDNVQDGILAKNEKGQLVLGVSLGKLSRDIGSILMPYTWEQDFNGKEIFVSDILSGKYKVEVYQNEEGTFMVKFHNNPKVNKPKSLMKFLLGRKKAGTEERDCIILGNTFEDANLLQGVS